MRSSKFGILITFPVENSLELFGNLNFSAEFGAALKSPNTVQFLVKQGGKSAGFCKRVLKRDICWQAERNFFNEIRRGLNRMRLTRHH